MSSNKPKVFGKLRLAAEKRGFPREKIIEHSAVLERESRVMSESVARIYFVRKALPPLSNHDVLFDYKTPSTPKRGLWRECACQRAERADKAQRNKTLEHGVNNERRDICKRRKRK